MNAVVTQSIGNYAIVGMVLQTLGVSLGILVAYRKWSQESSDARVEAAERLTRMETKVDILFNFWERTLERRSLADQKRSQDALERRARVVESGDLNAASSQEARSVGETP